MVKSINEEINTLSWNKKDVEGNLADNLNGISTSTSILRVLAR